MTATAEPKTEAQGRAGRRDLRPGRRRRVPARRAAGDQPRARDGHRARGRQDHRHRRGRAADRRGPRAAPICLKPTDGLHARHGRAQHRPRHPDAGRRRHARSRVERDRRAARHRPRPRSPSIDDRWEIHRDAPPFDQLEPKAQMFETGIKVIDLLEPYVQGGKIGLFGGAGVGKTDPHPGDDQPRRHAARWCVGVRRRRRAHA